MSQQEDFRLNVRFSDKSVRKVLLWQVLDPSDEAYGGFRNSNTLRDDQPLTCGMVGLCAQAYCHPDSTHFGSPDLEKRIELMSKFLAKVQHDDGSIDLTISNIFSAPDTGFAVRPISKAYELLGSIERNWARRTGRNLRTFLQKARTCLAHGEVHTPNHRWVVVAAMGEINRFFPSGELRAVSERYLSEGIDVNRDGMYIYERSTSTYSWISNRALIDIARLWRKPRLLGYVRRNLDFMIYHVHQNGEMVDEYSRRQDRGTHSLLSPLAFECYSTMALLDGNGAYASMADLAFSLNLARGGSPAGYMAWEDFARFKAIPREPLSTDYNAFFPLSGLVRIRKGKLDATIMAQNFDNFLTVRNGRSIVDSVKLRYNYWGWWNFNPNRVVRRGRTYELTDLFTGRTFNPGPREVRLRTKFEIGVNVKTVTDGFSMEVSTRGPENIVMQLDLGLRPEGTLSLGGRRYDLSRVKGPIFFDRDEALLSNGGDRILIQGGVVQHRIWDGWRGFNPWERYGKRTVSLLMTPVSPFDGVVKFTGKQSN